MQGDRRLDLMELKIFISVMSAARKGLVREVIMMTLVSDTAHMFDQAFSTTMEDKG